MSIAKSRINGRNKRTGNRILLVEDHLALASLRSVFLAAQGYEVICAADGQQAQRLIESEPFNVVVTDSTLPIRSGWEVAQFAKRKELPVILSSGWPVRMSPGQVAACGVDFLCPKPCSLDQLLSVIEKALKPRRKRQRRLNPVPKAQYQGPG